LWEKTYKTETWSSEEKQTWQTMENSSLSGKPPTQRRQLAC
jgi:hypothetical protein